MSRWETTSTLEAGVAPGDVWEAAYARADASPTRPACPGARMGHRHLVSQARSRRVDRPGSTLGGISETRHAALRAGSLG